jgi:hypothetical protein
MLEPLEFPETCREKEPLRNSEEEDRMTKGTWLLRT